MEDSERERDRDTSRWTPPAMPPVSSPPELRACLASHVGSAAQARALVGTALCNWRRADLLDDALIVTSELVTNAILHAAGAGIEIIVRLTGRAVRVEVRDDSARVPEPRASSDHATTGRGLALVDAIATSWGVDACTDGKHVWAEVS